MGSAVPAAANASSPSSCLLLGIDSRGNWVVRDQAGRRGGMFVNRAAALLYARLETGNRLASLVPVTGTLELGLSPGR